MVCMVKDPEYEEEIREDLYKVRVPNLEVWKGFQDLTASYLQLEEGKIDKMLYYLQTEDMEHFFDIESIGHHYALRD